KTVTGFEGGKIYPGYRYLFPIIFEGDHLGSVEFSISFEGIEDKLKSLMPESSFQLMMTKESTIDRVFEWHYSFFQQSDWHENYFVEAPSLSSVNQDIEANSRIQLLLKQVKESPVLKRAIEDKESFSFFTIDRGNGYFINFLEFKNTDNKHAGYILSYTKHNAIIALEGEYRLYKLLTIFSLFVVLFLLAIVLKQMASAKAYHIKLERFIDLQSSIVILSNGKKFTFANRSFYDFFGFKDLEAFKQKYDCICECFVVNDHFFSLDKVKEDEEQWVESLLNIPARKRIVSMIDQTKVAHAFSVGINTFDEQFYVVNFTDISDTMIEKLQLEKQATRDELTNAYNRAYFKNSIKSIRSFYEDQKLDTGLIFFDIDHFKQINDTYGHDIGDSVLKELVKRVQTKLRASDHLVRWGGEEFIVAVGSDSLESVAKVAEHLRHDIESFSFANVEKVTCSFGVAIGSSDTPIESIISDADKKLYEAKAAGRNQVQK
ncbi:MAG: GGDEF domain-containing protein, partial [Campylobacterota bacterium]|nr:GGDEF domain-containing protein [Campylobacterota bacterium]